MTSEEETLTLEAKTIRYLERSRTYPISFAFNLDASMLEEFELLHTITSTSMSRCVNLNIVSFDILKHWPPLGGTLVLKRLEITGELWSDEVGTRPYTILETECPSLNKFELDMMGSGAPAVTTSLLANISKFASITHLHITMLDAVIEVRDALAAFHDLQCLWWYSEESSDEEFAATALSLPKLEQLKLEGDTLFLSLTMLNAPLLRRLELRTYSENLLHWELLNPVQFPDLETLYCYARDSNVRRILGAIEGHYSLRNVCWRIRDQFIPEFIRAFSKSALAAQSSQPLLPQLDSVSIIPDVSKIPDEKPPPPSRWYAEIARQLTKFVALWNELSADRRSTFKLCLDEALVEASQEIADAVASYPEILVPRVHYAPLFGPFDVHD